MGFFEEGGTGGNMPPAGDYIGKITGVEIKAQPSFDDPEVMTQRACFTFTLSVKDPETGEPYLYYEWTGPKYGNPQARLTELLDQMFPEMSKEQKLKLMPDDICGKKFRLILTAKTKKNGKPGLKLAVITPFVAGKPAPVMPPPDDDDEDPFADS